MDFDGWLKSPLLKPMVGINVTVVDLHIDDLKKIKLFDGYSR